VALSADGERVVLATLSSFERGDHVINEPLVVLGRRDGRDFSFSDPVQYAEPMEFFYPLVAWTESGIVMVGRVSRGDASQCIPRLVHLDEAGTLLHAEDLPSPDVSGEYYPHALAPLEAPPWSRLLLACTAAPREGTRRWLEFWTYDARRKVLRRERSVANDFAAEKSLTNAGELLVRKDAPPLFLNNPASDALAVWEGDLFGSSDLAVRPLLETQPEALGFAGTRSLFLGNVFQGSVVEENGAFLATDVTPMDLPRSHRGPCSFLLWRLQFP
jgi:hypothetical protein